LAHNRSCDNLVTIRDILRQKVERLMRTVLLAGGISLVITATALAQGTAPPAAGGACYVELTRLMAEPPTGIGELGAAIRQLDTALRPQVEEIKVLKAQIARLERQTETVAQPG